MVAVDASAVARVLGIETKFKDLRGGSALFLPMRIAVVGQGSTASTYSTTKWQGTSAAAVGARYGYGSPLHLAAQQLLPSNGDGVGTIPVTFYPLDDHASGVASAGSITPSGTQTAAASYQVLINKIASETFTIAAGAIDVTAVCRSIHDSINAVLSMPVLATYTYGTVTAAADAGNAGDGTVTSLSVTGTPTPGAYTLTLKTAVSDGGVFSFVDPDGTALSDVTMTPGAGGTTVINQSGLQFTITDGSADFEVGDIFTITVPATAVVTTSKWKGVSANDIYIEVEGESLGTTFTIVQHTGGLVNPTVDSALAQIGNVWETLVLNCLNISDTTALGTYATTGGDAETGAGRWGALVRKPFVVFTGNTATTVANATAVSSARRTDMVNSQLPAPGSRNLPLVVAARQLARIAVVANNNPPVGYGAQRATGLTPGTDGDQWTYADRDQAVKAGSSTIEVVDGEVRISDVVTFYRPEGEDPPAYRYVVDIIKLMNVLFNMDLRFATAEWAAAPLIPDDQPTVNRAAKKPYMAKAVANNVIQSLADNAILANPALAKAQTTAEISASNPKRLDISVTVQVAGNTNIKSMTLNWGFFFGTPAVVA